jgi:hypothetical protein
MLLVTVIQKFVVGGIKRESLRNGIVVTGSGHVFKHQKSLTLQARQTCSFQGDEIDCILFLARAHTRRREDKQDSRLSNSFEKLHQCTHSRKAP